MISITSKVTEHRTISRTLLRCTRCCSNNSSYNRNKKPHLNQKR